MGCEINYISLINTRLWGWCRAIALSDQQKVHQFSSLAGASTLVPTALFDAFDTAILSNLITQGHAFRTGGLGTGFGEGRTHLHYSRMI